MTETGREKEFNLERRGSKTNEVITKNRRPRVREGAGRNSCAGQITEGEKPRAFMGRVLANLYAPTENNGAIERAYESWGSTMERGILYL